VSVEKALAYVDESEVVDLVKALVKIRSVNPPGLEKEASVFVAETLKGFGAEVELQYLTPDRPNVLGRFRGRKGSPTLLFEGHLDVVPVEDESVWVIPPFNAEEREGYIYGRGSTDAKGSLAAMLEGVKALVKSGVQLQGDLLVLAVVGEEFRNAGVRYAIEKGLRADMAVVLEPTDLKVKNLHKGILRLRVTTLGKAAHASTPWDGVNAVTKMASVIHELDHLAARLKGKRHATLGFPTLVVSTVSGGVKENIVPSKCTVTIDRRLIPGETPKEARDEVYDVLNGLKASDPEFNADVEVYYEADPAETPSEERIVTVTRRAVETVTGMDPGATAFTASCDMGPLVNIAGIPTVILGPGELALAHKDNERIGVNQLVEAAKVYALTAFYALT